VKGALVLVPDRYPMKDDLFTHAKKVVIEKSYQNAIDSPLHKSMLSYDPIIYTAPFMLSRKYKTERELARALFYGLSYHDVSNFASSPFI
jgi:hypothetical protein